MYKLTFYLIIPVNIRHTRLVMSSVVYTSTVSNNVHESNDIKITD